MNHVQFVAAAREEFLEEVAYYNAAQQGLGARFSAAVEKATALALAFPGVGSPYKAGTRRAIVKDFPFSVVYKATQTGIVIFAVAHHARRPGYWASRARTGR